MLNKLGLHDYTTVGEANTTLKEHLISGKKKANPQYVLVNQEIRKIGDEWGYISNARAFSRKLKSTKK